MTAERVGFVRIGETIENVVTEPIAARGRRSTTPSGWHR